MLILAEARVEREPTPGAIGHAERRDDVHDDRARSTTRETLIAGRSRALLQELGLTIEYWAAAQNAGRNEWLAGDLDAAADVLRESCEALETLGETAFLSTHATMLAELEVERGNLGRSRPLDRRRGAHGIPRRPSDAGRDPAGARRRACQRAGDPSADGSLPSCGGARRRDGHVAVAHRRAARARVVGCRRRDPDEAARVSTRSHRSSPTPRARRPWATRLADSSPNAAADLPSH